MVADLGKWLRAEALGLVVRCPQDRECAVLLGGTWIGQAQSLEDAIELARASYELSKLEPLGPVHVNAQTGEEL